MSSRKLSLASCHRTARWNLWGGIEAAQDDLHALMEGHYPGKVVIFPQISGLPLMGLPELKEHFRHHTKTTLHS